MSFDAHHPSSVNPSDPNDPNDPDTYLNISHENAGSPFHIGMGGMGGMGGLNGMEHDGMEGLEELEMEASMQAGREDDDHDHDNDQEAEGSGSASGSGGEGSNHAVESTQQQQQQPQMSVEANGIAAGGVKEEVNGVVGKKRGRTSSPTANTASLGQGHPQSHPQHLQHPQQPQQSQQHVPLDEGEGVVPGTIFKNAFNADDVEGDGDDDDDDDEPAPKSKKARTVSTTGQPGGFQLVEKDGDHMRRKIRIEYIGDKSRRHITFSKRKAGIMKKAYELSTLTGTQVLLLVVSETGLVYTFTTAKLQPLVTKPEGKNLIQACLNAPEGVGPDGLPTAVAAVATTKKERKGKDKDGLAIRPMKLDASAIQNLANSASAAGGDPNGNVPQLPPNIAARPRKRMPSVKIPKKPTKKELTANPNLDPNVPPMPMQHREEGPGGEMPQMGQQHVGPPHQQQPNGMPVYPAAAGHHVAPEHYQQQHGQPQGHPGYYPQHNMVGPQQPGGAGGNMQQMGMPQQGGYHPNYAPPQQQYMNINGHVQQQQPHYDQHMHYQQQRQVSNSAMDTGGM